MNYTVHGFFADGETAVLAQFASILDAVKLFKASNFYAETQLVDNSTTEILCIKCYDQMKYNAFK